MTAIGFYKHGARVSKLFRVSSAPLRSRPILAVIEVISYFGASGQPFHPSRRQPDRRPRGAQGVRGFAGALGLAAVAPILGHDVAIYGLELLVMVVQAYVFTIVTCVYLNDALHPVH